MAIVDLPISQGFYVSDSLPISNQRCVNFRPNVPQTSTITVDNLFQTPGIVGLTPKILNVISRGAHVMGDIPYCVIGTSLFRLNQTFAVDEAFDLELMGTIEGIKRVYMDDNGTQLCITAVPDTATVGKSYIFTESPDTLTEITDANFDGPAISMIYASGYFLFAKSSGKKFFNSPLLDGLGTYDPLDFSNATADPDEIRSLVRYKNHAYILGSLTVQVFRDIGRSPSPFSPLSTVIDVGVVAPQSVQRFAGVFVMVGAGVNEDPGVWAINGNTKTKLSTIAIDNELSKLTSVQAENIFSNVYAEKGEFFYIMTLPTTSFVYDATNQRWHERTSVAGVEQTQYRVSTMVKAYGRIIVGDLQDGRVGALDSLENLEYGRLVKRFVTSQPFGNSGKIIKVSTIEPVCESGVGLNSDITIELGEDEVGNILTGTGGKDPQITMSYSDDNGRNFVGDRSKPLGKIGQYKLRQIFKRIRRIPDTRVLKFEISTPNKAVILKVRANIA